MENQATSSLWAVWRSLPDLFRHFPYLTISAQYFPLFAYLYARGEIDSPAALLMLAPFVFSSAAGFAYNNLADRRDPPFKLNPIADGRLTASQARALILFCIASSFGAFALLYRSPWAWLVYLLYIFLGFAYSGLGLRLKETLAGPFIAAFVIWTAGPLILALEYNQLGDETIASLLGAIYLIYVGREVYHTLIDYENDLRAGYRTFAVRTGSITRRTMLFLAVSAGALCLLWSLYTVLDGAAPNTLALLLAAMIILAAGLEALYCLRHEGFHPATAFFLLRTAFILYAALILNLPALVTALLLWAFLIDRRN
jgi:4-hydroxybenzoate polyprenyltransferase